MPTTVPMSRDSVIRHALALDRLLTAYPDYASLTLDETSIRLSSALERVFTAFPEYASSTLKEVSYDMTIKRRRIELAEAPDSVWDAIPSGSDFSSVDQPGQYAPSFKNVNGRPIPYNYPNAVYGPARRPDFADAVPNLKPAAHRNPHFEQPTEPKSARSYSSFDSNSLIFETIPKEITRADEPGIGAKGDYEILDPNLRGVAHLITNFLPPTAYIVAPSVDIVHAFLHRAYDMPRFVMAVAGVILGSLSWGLFAEQWRAQCPLNVEFPANGTGPFGSYSHDGTTLRAKDLPAKSRWVSPEIIVLAALALADVFSPDDRDRVDKWWLFQVGHGRYTAAQFNATKRCLLLDLDHNLLPCTKEVLVRKVVREMAKWQYTVTNRQVEEVFRRLSLWEPLPSARQSWYEPPPGRPTNGGQLTVANLQAQQVVLREERARDLRRRGLPVAAATIDVHSSTALFRP